MSGTNPDYDDDDYVAKMLAEDAKKSSQRYAAVGLAALLPQRRTKAAPKPNTRFLNHLVREVDNHNTTLRKKEEFETRIRLSKINDQERKDEERNRAHRRKRRHTNGDGSDEVKRDHRLDDLKAADRGNSPRRPRGDRSQDHRTSSRTYRTYHEENKSHSHARRRHSRSPEDHSEDRTRSARSLTPDVDSSARKKSRSKRSVSPLSLSDPLEDLTSPRSFSWLPKPRIRGRGAQAPSQATSNIDKHFSSTYDPSLDLHPEDETNSEREDWDMALEALRDRTMWKKKQSERMRDAGFEEEQIKDWANNSRHSTTHDQGNITSVKWAKQGEAREWDRGKRAIDHS